jgi:hypothetical protein
MESVIIQSNWKRFWPGDYECDRCTSRIVIQAQIILLYRKGEK